jgi:hypothetical protein
MSARLAAWIARQHRRVCALDALQDMGVDVGRVRLVRLLVEQGAFTDWPPPGKLPT